MGLTRPTRARHLTPTVTLTSTLTRALTLSRYDQEVDEKEKEIAALRAIYDEEKKELTRLEDYFNQVRVSVRVP